MLVHNSNKLFLFTAVFDMFFQKQLLTKQEVWRIMGRNTKCCSSLSRTGIDTFFFITIHPISSLPYPVRGLILVETADYSSPFSCSLSRTGIDTCEYGHYDSECHSSLSRTGIDTCQRLRNILVYLPYPVRGLIL